MIVLQEPITLYHRTEALPIPKIEVRRNNHEEVCLRYSDDGNHTIYFPEECVFHSWYRICYGLPMYIEVAAGIAFTASVWAVVALAISVWVPDKLLTVAIPSFLYHLWNTDV